MRQRVDNATLLALLYGTNEKGFPRTYTEIAPLVGICRERVRQRAKHLLGETGRERQRVRLGVKKELMKLSWRGFSPKVFSGMIRRWLSSIGHSYCCSCHRVLLITDMEKGRGRRCRPCVALKGRRWYSTANGKTKLAAWRKANPDKCKAYQRTRQGMVRHGEARPGEARSGRARQAR